MAISPTANDHATHLRRLFIRPAWGVETLMRILKCIRSRAYAALGLWVLLWGAGCASPPPTTAGLDVLSYTYTLHLPENLAEPFPFEAEITLASSDKVVMLHLVRHRFWRDGAEVDLVEIGGRPVPFLHAGGRLTLHLDTLPDTLHVRVSGITRIPKPWRRRGTLATDPWPDRTGWWLPVHAHPADDAFHHFEVTAPTQFTILASGRLVRSKTLPSERTQHTFLGLRPLSPAVVTVIASTNIVYTQTNTSGFWSEPAKVERGAEVQSVMEEGVPWLVSRLGPMPFEPISTVFTFTQYLGMEYAGLPRVHLSTISDDFRAREILVHEWVHQWIGAARFPALPEDLWVSEGFATYVTALYLNDVQGVPLPLEAWHSRAAEYAQQNPRCVLHTSATYAIQLSPHVYERAALVWHALHEEVGDPAFWAAARMLAQGLGGIGSAEVKAAFEATSGMNLEAFWQTWLLSPHFPPTDGGTGGCP